MTVCIERSSLDIAVASSAGKVVYFATILHTQKLKVAALLDSDAAGDQVAKQDTIVHTLGNKGILRTKDSYTGEVNKPEIEDLLRDTPEPRLLRSPCKLRGFQPRSYAPDENRGVGGSSPPLAIHRDRLPRCWGPPRRSRAGTRVSRDDRERRPIGRSVARATATVQVRAGCSRARAPFPSRCRRALLRAASACPLTRRASR
jgi:hypothetical protein